MSIAEELKKLEGLHWSGTLTDAEFAQAKAALLAQLSPPEPAGVAERLGEHLAEVRYQNELERIDREWAQEREKYLVTGKDGRRYIPTAGTEIGGAIFIGVFGAVWTVMAVAITGGAPDVGPFAIARVVFPLAGVAFTAFGIWTALSAANKAEAYTRARAAYQRRRAAVAPDDFR